MNTTSNVTPLSLASDVSDIREIVNIGRCKICKKGFRHRSLIDMHSVYKTSIVGPFTYYLADRKVTIECCGQLLTLKPLRAWLVSDKPCDGRCMGATGPSCDCSCQGRNHGGKWATLATLE